MNMRGGSYEADVRQTLENRKRLHANANLMYWYDRLYAQQFAGEPDFRNKRVLEIGSGSSPLKAIHPGILASDVLALDYLDMVFDCHEIADLAAIPDGSLDIITLTNVLHHLRDPLAFLRGATRKLARGGRVYLAKDARMKPEIFRAMYPRYQRWQQIKAQVDPQGIFSSDLSRRLQMEGRR